ncbi:hypothetical protein M409DRAFT_18946 [Zasmidium cellare ATCC 36951]|uniref:Cercosporin MFS transporter CTB4 n=1 Tax=Zasmidium cellare ATCC 36951 TaxID=1080233 RepID=A0A6A6D013_ZASCE|nr:uncharacterized protein M409DRAFT_18946 [Zasmidium cellare ATCC 36951]KAF2170976.1 hypothetical protein M409DRAFT_18946 [Zasmidium cellare ATCC 36951]
MEVSAQSSKESLASPVEDKKDLEAQMEGENERTPPQGEPQPPSQLPKDPNLVEFDGPDDPGNPKNWSVKRRAAITISMGWMTFVVTFSSSIFAVAIEPVSQEFGIGSVVATLGVSFFLLGFVFGPIAFGPASEVYGRRVPLFLGYIIFAIFQIPVAVAQNVETIMICRFLGGFAASAPLAVVGGAMADLWDPVERAYAICAFAAGAFVGPVAGPIIGGFVVESYLGWRWTAWITLIMAALFGFIGLIVIPETSAARILQIRAKEMRYQTQNWALHAKADENRITAKTILTVYLARPFVMIVKEPILALITAYMSYLYGVIYMLFEAFPISFHDQRGWSLGVSALPFISFVVGIFMGAGMMSYSAATNFKRAYIKHGRPIPEERLPPMIVGAVVLPIAFFWWAWTSFPSISWIPQVFATAFLGMGFLVAFWEGMLYLIDCYGFYSNSAIAVNTFARSLAGAAFPLFSRFMFEGMGVQWGASLLGFICLLFAPAPWLFYKYGARIRARSKFTPTG